MSKYPIPTGIELSPLPDSAKADPIDHVSVFPVIEVEDEVRRVDNDADAHFFSTYIHHNNAKTNCTLATCIADCATREQAESVKTLIDEVRSMPTKADHSFAETLAMIVSNIYGDAMSLSHFTSSRENSMGQIEMLNELIEWAKEFEAAHAGEEWIDQDFYDEIDGFIALKLQDGDGD